MSFTEFDKIKWIFKKQTEKHAKHTKAYQKAVVDAKLFEYSDKLTLTDMKKVRSGDFWEKHDSLESELERNTFTLQRIKKFFLI